jgi:Ca2+-binding RTX toxin-like protein
MHLQSLERRRLLTVTVSEGYPGFFEVFGTPASDTIEISVNMAEMSMTLDGVTYQNVQFVAVYGYGGNDRIDLSTPDGYGWTSAAIHGGDGNDTLALAFDGAIWGGNGNDAITLKDSYRGEAYGEAGNDSILILGNTVDAELRGGDGDDTLDARGNFYPVVLRGGDGNDLLYGSDHDDVLQGDAGNDTMWGASGDDTFYASDGNYDYSHGSHGHDVLHADATEGSIDGIEEVY